MTSQNPQIASQIMLPPATSKELRELYETISARDKEFAERIESIANSFSRGFPTSLSDLFSAILNRGFELRGTGGSAVFESWFNLSSGSGSVSQDSQVVHAGSYSAKLVQGLGATRVEQELNITPVAGAPYTLQFWARYPTGSNPPRYEVIQGGVTPIPLTSCTMGPDLWALTAVPFALLTNDTAYVKFYPSATNGHIAYIDDVLIAPQTTYVGVDTIVYQLAVTLAQLMGAW